jgi:hypothetical protein
MLNCVIDMYVANDQQFKKKEVLNYAYVLFVGGNDPILG